MILIVRLLFQVNFGSPISTLPKKLRLYQQRTGIDGFKLNKIFEQYFKQYLKQFDKAGCDLKNYFEGWFIP